MNDSRSQASGQAGKRAPKQAGKQEKGKQGKGKQEKASRKKAGGLQCQYNKQENRK